MEKKRACSTPPPQQKAQAQAQVQAQAFGFAHAAAPAVPTMHPTLGPTSGRWQRLRRLRRGEASGSTASGAAVAEAAAPMAMAVVAASTPVAGVISYKNKNKNKRSNSSAGSNNNNPFAMQLEGTNLRLKRAQLALLKNPQGGSEQKAFCVAREAFWKAWQLSLETLSATPTIPEEGMTERPAVHVPPTQPKRSVKGDNMKRKQRNRNRVSAVKYRKKKKAYIQVAPHRTEAKIT